MGMNGGLWSGDVAKFNNFDGFHLGIMIEKMNRVKGCAQTIEEWQPCVPELSISLQFLFS
jgi:hypothetical protein